MFARYPIDSITNGVHAGTWARPHSRGSSIATFPAGGRTTSSLRYALGIPPANLEAHMAAKPHLLEHVYRETSRAG